MPNGEDLSNESAELYVPTTENTLLMDSLDFEGYDYIVKVCKDENCDRSSEFKIKEEQLDKTQMYD